MGPKRHGQNDAAQVADRHSVPSNSGSIKLGAKEITRLPPHERVYNGIAFVPQGRMIFASLTVTENNPHRGARDRATKRLGRDLCALSDSPRDAPP